LTALERKMRSNKKLRNPKKYSKKFPVIFPKMVKFAINGKPIIFHPDMQYHLNYPQFELVFNSAYFIYLK